VIPPVTRDDARAAVDAISSEGGFEPSFSFMIEALGGSRLELVRDVMYFLSTHRARLQPVRVALLLGLGAMDAPRSRVADITSQWADLPVEVRTFVTNREAERWLSGR